MAEHTLRIHRLHPEYLFSRDHSAPEFVRAELDASLTARFGAECTRCLDALGRADDPTIWCIPALELEFTIPLTGAPERLPRTLAMRLAQALAASLDHPGPGTRVFRDRVAYVAAFVSDVLAGRAWDQWFYGEFDGLRSLPNGTAAAEALGREPAVAVPVLRELARNGQFESFLRVVPGRDLDRLVQICAASAPTAGPEVQPSVVEAMDPATTRSAGPLGTSVERRLADTLRKLVGWSSVQDAATLGGAVREPSSGLQDADDPEARPAAPGTSKSRPAAVAELGNPLDARDAPEARESRDEGGGTPGASGDSGLGFDGRTDEAAAPASIPAGWDLTSPYAGVVLLLRSLVELHLADAFEGRGGTSDDHTDLRAALRAWVVIGAFGSRAAAELAGDPVLLTLCGAVPPLPSETECCRQVEPMAGAHLLDRLRDHLLGLGLARGAQLRIARLDSGTPGECLLLVRDLPADAWLGGAFCCAGETMAAALHDLLGEVTRAAGQPPDVVLLPPDLGVRPRNGGPWRLVEGSLPADTEAADGCAFSAWVGRNIGDPELAIAEACTSARTLKDARQELTEFGGFEAGLEPPASALMRLSLRLVSRALLRDVARRLPGFGASSPEFLRANVLTGPLRMVSVPDGWRAQFGPVPLQVLLGMTGLDHTLFRLPWLGSHDRIELALLGA